MTSHPSYRIDSHSNYFFFVPARFFAVFLACFLAFLAVFLPPLRAPFCFFSFTVRNIDITTLREQDCGMETTRDQFGQRFALTRASSRVTCSVMIGSSRTTAASILTSTSLAFATTGSF